MVEFHHPEDSRDMGPVAIAREVHKRVMEGGDHDISASLATVKIRDNQFGGMQMKIRFHERLMTGDFVFKGSSQGRSGDDSVMGQMADMQGTKHSMLMEFTDDIGRLSEILKLAYDLNDWEFAELEAASIGGMGGLTDYEFVFETGTTKDEFSRDAIDRAVDSMNRRVL